MITWVVYTKGAKLPLWKSENKKDLDIIIRQLPDAISSKLYIAKAEQ